MAVLASTTVDLARAAVRDDLDLPLPVRPADARARAAGGGHADALAPHEGRALASADAASSARCFLINIAIGVATGLVQEFEFGMNWSVYSRFVGNVFGAPLAIEGLAAFMLESTFLGLWIFGWDRLRPRLHLATLWIAVLGSGCRPTSSWSPTRGCSTPSGYKIVNGRGAADERLGAALERVGAATHSCTRSSPA